MKNYKPKLKIIISVVLAASLVLGYFSFFRDAKTVTAAWWPLARWANGPEGMISGIYCKQYV